ncbi:GAF and ANTAR domain-containing protein [Microbacterium sp. 4R-513]|uniref:GAF and ANTAR domain-containing protein n=1 Tax=Microbacterium sp. 4R-513 TaxID=2567934 RepID=UPI0013E1532D|nr:GAF and ANTAR domain-containing protein [Microbacterium sp. 4R-513]QIG39475.1 GAF and ANTAR domain-containing protein [Microbacterium sp. 4R-513]
MRSREDHLLHTVASLADSLVADFHVVDLLQLLVEECTALFDASAAGILLQGSTGELEVIASTNERSEFIGLMQLQFGEGPCVEAVTSGEVVSVPDLSQVADRWPAFAAAARQSGFASLHAIPMRLRDATIGSLNLFRDRVGELNRPDAIAARALTDIATISILQQRLVEESSIAQAQLQRALDSRVIIEQAKGYLAQSRGLDMDAAFQRIRSHARSTQTRLTDVAAAIVAGDLTL